MELCARESITGSGGQVDIKFLIKGQTQVKSKTVSIHEFGHITVSASDLLGDGIRPAMSKTAYYWPQSGSQVTAQSSAVPNQPHALYLIHAVKPGTTDPDILGMAMTSDKELAQTALKYAQVSGSLLTSDNLWGWAMSGKNA